MTGTIEAMAPNAEEAVNAVTGVQPAAEAVRELADTQQREVGGAWRVALVPSCRPPPAVLDTRWALDKGGDTMGSSHGWRP